MYHINYIPSPGASPLPIYHPNGATEEDKLYLADQSTHLAVSTSGNMSFELFPDHPYLSSLQIMKGVVELLDGTFPIYRGRITTDHITFRKTHRINTEGMLACLNDSAIPPFVFPDNFLDNPDYQTAASSGNVVEYFLGWILNLHNASVGDEQKIYLGNVTVTDPNNYIARSSKNYETAWKTCSEKLFGSSLGGYFLIRYEPDGNYLDYVNDFPLTNVQRVRYAENLLDLNSEKDGTGIYTAILPVGKDGLTIEELPDGDFTPDIVKSGSILYSRSAENEQGGRITKIVPFEDVTKAINLRRKAGEILAGNTMPETISCLACDLHSIDRETPSFCVGRWTEVISDPHGYRGLYPCMVLEPDILHPAKTPIQLGRTQASLTRSLSGNNAPKDGRDGSDGSDGNDGIGISDVVLEYILSTSSTEIILAGEEIQGVVTDDGNGNLSFGSDAPATDDGYSNITFGVNTVVDDDGSRNLTVRFFSGAATWKTTVPTITDGTFLWSRQRIDYSDGTTEYTTPMCISKATSEVIDPALSEMRESINESITSIAQNTESIVLEAMNRYVETGNYDAFVEEMRAALAVMSDQIEMNLTQTTTRIEDVNGDLQEFYDTVTKYFRFTADGLIIGESGNETVMKLDNDLMEILRNDFPQLWLDEYGANMDSLHVRVIYIGGFTLIANGDTLTLN